MIRISLSRGAFALIDDADAALAEFRWSFHPGSRTHYAARNHRGADGRWRLLLLHRAVLGLTGSRPFVDHRNGNGWDCRRENLRIADASENARNRPRHRNNMSGYKGVHLCKGDWLARIRVNGSLIYLGSFRDPVEAARAYDRAALEYHGEFARLNFPLPDTGVQP